MAQLSKLSFVTILLFVLLNAINNIAIAAPSADIDIASIGLSARSGYDTCNKRTRLRRKAWHTFSKKEKWSYINAELCLMKKPARTGLPAVQTLFDDLQATHQVQAWSVHNTGWFLPYHRLLMWAHEKLLRDECGYKGTQPYWDESPEAGDFAHSDIFNPYTGFGGDGTGANVTWEIPGFPFPAHTGRCIQDGPFKDYKLHIGPSFSNTEHCISRAINDTASLEVAQINVDFCMTKPNFSTAWPCIELFPHNGGHGGVSGEMLNPISSPGDPLFYLHHTWLDKVWWDWQNLDYDARIVDIAGKTSTFPPMDGSPWIDATLEDELTVFGLVRNYTVKEVMDQTNGPLCVEYVNAKHPPQKRKL